MGETEGFLFKIWKEIALKVRVIKQGKKVKDTQTGNEEVNSLLYNIRS